MEKDAASKLSNHSKEFNKKEVKISHQSFRITKFQVSSYFSRVQNILQVLKVGENVYVAIGYGLANSIMLEVVVIVVGVIIIKMIIIYDCVEGRRRDGHHRHSGELRSGQGGSRGL